jgi:hypothetical protein
MRHRLGALLLAMALLVLPPRSAKAQLGPTIDEKTTVIAELLVRAYGGPPWWKVSDNDTTIYVMATPTRLPAGLAFDDKLLERRISGANDVILTPRMADGPLALFNLPSGQRLFKKINEGTRTDLEPSLPEDLRRRFAAVRTRIGQPEARYGSLAPGLAGMALAGDASYALLSGEPTANRGVNFESLVVALARKHRVRTVPAMVYGGRATGGLIGELSKPGLPCLTSTLDRLEKPATLADPPERVEAIQAWAEGDVRPLLDRIRKGGGETPIALHASKDGKSAHILITTPECLAAVPTALRIGERYIDDEVAALERALAKPGHSVAILEPGSLLISGGVLDQLRRKGFTVKAPDAE